MRIMLTRLEEDMKAIGMPPPPAAKKQPPAAPAAPAPQQPMPPEDEEGIDPTDPNMTGMGGDMDMEGDQEDPLAGIGGDAQAVPPVSMPPEDEAAPAPAQQCSCQGGGSPMESARQRMQRRYGESRRPAAPARRTESALERRTASLLEGVQRTLGEISGSAISEARKGFGLMANNAHFIARGLERAALARRNVKLSETAAAVKRLSKNCARFVESLDARQITVAESKSYFTRYFSALVEAADLYDRLVEDDEDDEGGQTDKKGKDGKNKMSAWNDREPVEPGENLDQPTEGDESDDDEDSDSDPDAELEDEEPPFADDGDEEEEPAEESKGRNFRRGGKRR